MLTIIFFEGELQFGGEDSPLETPESTVALLPGEGRAELAYFRISVGRDRRRIGVTLTSTPRLDTVCYRYLKHRHGQR